ncbi:hypothetical protein ACFL12_02210 [Pseudomonadota bacterium]
MFKKIAIGLGLLVVVVAVGIVYLVQNAGDIVQAVIESEGSRTTQVAVTVDSAEVKVMDQFAAIRGLSVANPAGFKTDRAMSLGEVSVKLADNWTPDVIVVEEVMVIAPEITYEIGGSGSNIAKIQENVQNFMNAMSGGKAAAPSEPAADSDGGKKVIINNLWIKDGRVNVSATLLQGKSLGAPLPTIHLTDIGKDEGGASPAEVVEKVIGAITKSASGAASGVDLGSLGLENISGKAAEIGGAAADAAKGALEGVGGAAGGAAGGAVEGLKGLFGN